MKDTRIDAEANREALIKAAKQAFSENGPETSLSVIARNAGVSRATLYRNFPDRKSLVTAILKRNVDDLENYAASLGPEVDTFFKSLEFIVAQQVRFQSLVQFMKHRDRQEIKERIISIFKDPVKKALEQNSLRKDFDLEIDIELLFNMLGGVLITDNAEVRKQKIKRALSLLIGGLKGE